MKSLLSIVRLRAAVGLCLLLTAAAASGASFQVGQVVSNFLVYARPSWTNSMGFADNAPIRLDDFAGKILFLEFFDPT
jgi:hypothetical protein